MKIGERFGLCTPYAALTGVQRHQAEFTEKGASGFDLTAHVQNHTVYNATPGIRYDTRFNSFFGVSTVSGWMAWPHTLSGVNLGFQAAFASTPTATFTVQGQDLASNVAQTGVNPSTLVNRH